MRAKKQADEFAAGFVGPDLNGKADAEPEPLTLGGLFDIYGEEVTPTKGAHSRGHDRAAMRMFLRFIGGNRDPATLSQRDWDRFIRERRAGRIGPSGRPVSDRTVEYDLKLLIAVLNWAAKSRDEQGRLLLDRNPLRGLQDAHGKEPDPGGAHRRGISGAAEGVAPGGLAVPRWRSCSHTRPDTGLVQSVSFGGADIDFEGGAIRLARRARQVGLRTHHARYRARPSTLLEGCVWSLNALEPGRLRCCPRPGIRWRISGAARLHAWWQQGPDSCGAGTDAWQGLALAEAQVCLVTSWISR